MKLLFALFIGLIACVPFNSGATVAVTQPATVGVSRPDIFSIQVDKVTIDTDGLRDATDRLSVGLDRLSKSIRSLSNRTGPLQDDEKAILMEATQSVGKASEAVHKLANQITAATARLSEQLPTAIRDSEKPIADISEAIQAASKTALALTENFSEVAESSKKLATQTADTVLQRVLIYASILIALLSLVLVALIMFTYFKTVRPLVTALDLFREVPGQLHAMSGHLKTTSDNLLAMKQSETPEQEGPAD